MKQHISIRILRAAMAAVILWLPSCAATSDTGKPRDETLGGSYAFWPPFPAEPRIQFVRSYSGSGDLSAKKESALESIVFGKEVEREARINKPYGVAMRDGRIYVCDMRGASLVVLDLRKKQTRILGASGANRLAHPVAVAVADDGLIYVADNQRGAIIVFDANERYSHAIGFEKFRPAAVAVHGERLYACDMGAQVVQVFERRTGKLLGAIGSVGDEDGQFRLPLGVCTDRDGNVYVSDMMRGRVQKFTPDGRFVAGVGTIGDATGTFARAKHLAVDADGIVYVVDSAFQNVQMFDDQFRLLTFFGAAGPFPGSMNLPVGVAVCETDVDLFREYLHPGFEAQRLIIVTNQFGPNFVSVYALGRPREGYTPADLARSAAKVAPGVGANTEFLQFQEQGQIGEPVPEKPPEPEAPAAPQPK